MTWECNYVERKAFQMPFEAQGAQKAEILA